MCCAVLVKAPREHCGTGKQSRLRCVCCFVVCLQACASLLLTPYMHMCIIGCHTGMSCIWAAAGAQGGACPSIRMPLAPAAGRRTPRAARRMRHCLCSELSHAACRGRPLEPTAAFSMRLHWDAAH